MKKKILLFLSVLIFISLLPACTFKEKEKEYSFRGTVEEVYENSVLVRVEDSENLSADLIHVSLNDDTKEKIKDLMKGDLIVIYYDGIIAESYPAQIHGAYKIERLDGNEED